MFLYKFIIDVESRKTFPLDSVEVSKLRSTEKKPCDQKFEKFDKILIRENSNVIIQDIYNFFLFNCSDIQHLNLYRDLMEQIRHYNSYLVL